MIRRSCERAFTLLEMSVVLLIISVIVGGGIAVMNNSINQRMYNETVTKMETIQTALSQYRNAFGRIPCPAGISFSIGKTTAPTFGTEVGTAGDGLCAGASQIAGNVVAGAVPVKSLQLPDDFAFDGWGRRIYYVADRRFTTSNAFTTYPVSDITTGEIQVLDATGGIIEGRAIQLLLSHGKDGHGAWNRQGASRINAASTNANQWSNCSCNATLVATPVFDANFVQAPIPLDGSSTTTTFDDMVLFNTRRTLASPSE